MDFGCSGAFGPPLGLPCDEARAGDPAAAMATGKGVLNRSSSGGPDCWSCEMPPRALEAHAHATLFTNATALL
eukprot:824700-Alexandrium_andersonii.AAC.1